MTNTKLNSLSTEIIDAKGILFCKVYFVIAGLQFFGMFSSGSLLSSFIMVLQELGVIYIWTLLYQKFKSLYPEVRTKSFEYRIGFDIMLLITFYFFLRVFHSGWIFLQYIIVPFNCIIILLWGYVNYRAGKSLSEFDEFSKLGFFLKNFVSISALFYVYQVISDSSFIRLIYDIIQIYSMYLIFRIFKNDSNLNN